MQTAFRTNLAGLGGEGGTSTTSIAETRRGDGGWQEGSPQGGARAPNQLTPPSGPACLLGGSGRMVPSTVSHLEGLESGRAIGTGWVSFSVSEAEWAPPRKYRVWAAGRNLFTLPKAQQPVTLDAAVCFSLGPRSPFDNGKLSWFSRASIEPVSQREQNSDGVSQAFFFFFLKNHLLKET